MTSLYLPRSSETSLPHLLHPKEESSTSSTGSPFRSGPIVRTISSSSQLNLRFGSLTDLDHQQQTSTASSSRSSIISSSSSLSITSLSSPPPMTPTTPSLHKPSPTSPLVRREDSPGVFSRLMDTKANKSSIVLPLLTIATPVSICASPPPPLSPTLGSGSPSSSSAASSPCTPPSIAETPFLLSQSIMSTSTLPSAIMGRKVSLGAAGGSPTCLFPLVGRDYLNYSNLNALVTGRGLTEAKPRPLSSMENAESWLPSSADNDHSSSPIDTSTVGATANVASASLEPDPPRKSAEVDARLSLDQHSIHPLDADEPSPSSSSSQFLETSLPACSRHCGQLTPTDSAWPQERIIKKRPSFAEKLRNVFTNKGSPSVDSSGLRARRSLSRGTSQRNSVQDGDTSESASSSNVISPLSACPSPLSVQETPASVGGHGSGGVGPMLSLSSPISVQAAEGESKKDRTAYSLEPTPTRTVKKRLSFASISSFFNPRQQLPLASQEDSKTKQQRSSSVPNVENPTVTVERQIAGFQRRHSSGDLHATAQRQRKQQMPLSLRRLTLSSWEKNGKLPADLGTEATPVDGAPATAAVSAGTVMTPTIPVVATTPGKKLKLSMVFSKQSRKKSTPSATSPTGSEILKKPTKPLKSALRSSTSAQRSRRPSSAKRRTPSIRSHQGTSRFIGHANAHHRHSQSEPMAYYIDEHESTRAGNMCVEDYGPGRGNRPHHRRRGSRQSSVHSAPANEGREFCSSPLTYESPEVDLFDQCQQQQQHPYQQSYQQPPHYPNSNMLASPTRTMDGSTHGFETGALTNLQINPRVLVPSTTPQRGGDVSSGPTFYGSSSSEKAEASVQSYSDGSYPSSCASSPRSMSQPRSLLDPVYTPLLPASAARISVDRIAMDNQQSNMSISGTGTLTGPSDLHQRRASLTTATSTTAASTFESSSTASSSAASSTSSPTSKTTSTTLASVADDIAKPGVQQGYYYYKSDPYQQIQMHRQQKQQSFDLDPVSEHPYLDHQHHQQHHHHHHQQHHHKHPYASPHIPSHAYYLPYSPSQEDGYPPRPPRQLQFSIVEPTIHPTWTPEQYDRTSDPNITASRLTPAIAHKIKIELNQFKSQEMRVHEDSRTNTHFFI